MRHFRVCLNAFLLLSMALDGELAWAAKPTENTDTLTISLARALSRDVDLQYMHAITQSFAVGGNGAVAWPKPEAPVTSAFQLGLGGQARWYPLGRLGRGLDFAADAQYAWRRTSGASEGFTLSGSSHALQFAGGLGGQLTAWGHLVFDSHLGLRWHASWTANSWRPETPAEHTYDSALGVWWDLRIGAAW